MNTCQGRKLSRGLPPKSRLVPPRKKRRKERKMHLKTNKQRGRLLLLGFIVFITACNTGQRGENKGTMDGYVSSETIQYAEGFRIDHAEQFTRLTILNPWSRSSSAV